METIVKMCGNCANYSGSGHPLVGGRCSLEPRIWRGESAPACQLWGMSAAPQNDFAIVNVDAILAANETSGRNAQADAQVVELNRRRTLTRERRQALLESCTAEVCIRSLTRGVGPGTSFVGAIICCIFDSLSGSVLAKSDHHTIAEDAEAEAFERLADLQERGNS